MRNERGGGGGGVRAERRNGVGRRKGQRLDRSLINGGVGLWRFYWAALVAFARLSRAAGLLPCVWVGGGGVGSGCECEPHIAVP